MEGKSQEMTRAHNGSLKPVRTYPRVISFAAGDWTSVHPIWHGDSPFLSRERPFPPPPERVLLVELQLGLG